MFLANIYSLLYQFSSVAQSCPTLSDPMDCSLPGSSVHGIFQARVLEWGAIAFSNLYDSYLKVKVTQSCLTLCNPMDYTVYRILQARALEWVLFPSPGDLPNPGIEPRSPTLQADFLPAEPPGKPNLKSTLHPWTSVYSALFTFSHLTSGAVGPVGLTVC